MKKQSGPRAIETHDIRQTKYPAGRGSDLGATTAIPFGGAVDVDMEMNGRPGEKTFEIAGTKGGKRC
jgi:hypothetical protein